MYLRIENAESEKTIRKDIERQSLQTEDIHHYELQKIHLYILIIHDIVPITVPEPSLESSPIYKRPQTRNYHFTVGQ
jgi:hypothetical protein